MSGGRLLTGPDDLLPKNTFGLPNANEGPFEASELFLAGDVRANEHVALTAMHTVFVREHNRLADDLALENPGWTDEQIYQRARKTVGAQMQVVTYQEFLPALLGSAYAPDVTSRYDSARDASIANEFSTGLYRLGHSMIDEELLRIQNDGSPAPGGHLPLRDAFFDPTRLSSSEIDYILKGMSAQKMQEVDTKIVDGLRNFLFGPPGAGGLDLASLNIQRGRDHGLPDYNATRVAYGLPAVTSFSEITSDPDLQDDLASLYGNVDNIDLWVGALAEDHMPNSSVGELLVAGIAEQFTRLREGDRFGDRNDPNFSFDDLAALEATKLSDIIMRNTGISVMQSDVMFVPEPSTIVLFILGMCLLAGRRPRSVPST